MKLKLGNWYKYRGEDYKCIRLSRGKASLKRDCILYVDVPCSLVFIKPTSQVFADYK